MLHFTHFENIINNDVFEVEEIFSLQMTMCVNTTDTLA